MSDQNREVLEALKDLVETVIAIRAGRCTPDAYTTERAENAIEQIEGRKESA